MGQNQAHGEEDPDSEVALQHIQELYRKFANECPSGNLHLHEFKKIFGFSKNSTEEESAYMENVFRSFDTNGDGHIDFLEYVAAVHLILRGKLKDKLVWSFKVFDRDGNGSLDRAEVGLIIKIIGNIKQPQEPNSTRNVDEIVERIFALIDKNNDSEISLEEFIDGAEKDPWVLNQLKLNIGPCEWFMEQQERKNSTS
ncbi:guanylyl cyclase-activating protein 2-like [Periophthalmus magnuspinnatus]|uniref:guanylyl cyclase-activating protein 2-like n=1 Tax=Periophthalmus magnuspinnatus TaxID=409849 RepID=UPI00145B5345|nr:guanylyl cyclase-activating protein 2-like [Periophthalmus magnuspinnatus]